MMMDENLPPFEIFETIADERIDNHLEPRLKTFRGEQKRQQEVAAAELNTIREAMRSEIDSVKRSCQDAIDSLSSKLIETRVELANVLHLAALNQAKIAYAAAGTAKVDRNLLARKYEATMVEMNFSDDPLEVSDRFHQFCMDEGKKLGVPTIRPGLTTRA